MRQISVKNIITKIMGSFIVLPLLAFAEGGIGVGNLRNKAEEIPDSKMMISYNESWKSAIKSNKLILESKYGSIIEAKLTKGSELNIPPGKNLQSYMTEEQPEHQWRLVDVEGLKGVRGDQLLNENEKSTIVYLASDSSDFIQVTAYLKNNPLDQKEGEEILGSVRIKYLGKPIINSPVKKVALNHYGSFADDYFPLDRYTPVNSVASYFPGGDNILKIGAAGAQWGRIVDLGPNSEVPFDKIQIRGKYLEAPQGAIPLDDIYTVFTPNTLTKGQNSLKLQEGHVYLIRTIDWPEEDLITKIRVESLASGKRVITYQKLVYVDPRVLQKQVDQMVEYSKKYEQPISTGTVTLYERVKWDSYPHASFSFEYSSSGNVHITNNGWDIRFEAYNNQPYLFASRSGSEASALIPFSHMDFNQIQKKDFPKSIRGYPERIVMQKDDIYGVYHKVYTEKGGVGSIYGVLKVLDIAPDFSWVKLKFRRIALEAATPMLEWEELPVNSNVEKRLIDPTRDQCHFRNCSLEPGSPIEFYFTTFNGSTSYGKPEIHVDSRPFGSKRGFLKLKNKKNLKDYSLEEINHLKGDFVSRLTNYSSGEIYFVNFEDYEQRILMIFKIERVISEGKIEFSLRTFKHLKALR